MAHPASRVLTLLELLQANRRMTVSELAGRLEVNERTVRRYVDTLAELGIPVTAERGRYGGYRLLPGFKLPPLMFTDEEAVAAVLGLVAADRLGLAAAAPATAAAEAKIVRVLPPALADRLAALRESLGFTMRRPQLPAGLVEGAPPDTDILLTLAAATRARERLRLSYRKRSRDESVRELDPYGLVFHVTRWYVVGHDHRSGEIRSFRVDRILGVEPTGATFEPPAGFDAVEHLNRQLAGLPWQWEVEVLMEAEMSRVRPIVPATMAELTETPEGVRMICRAHNLHHLAQMLAGMAWPFTVVRPAELRTALARHGAMLIVYAGRGQ